MCYDINNYQIAWSVWETPDNLCNWSTGIVEEECLWVTLRQSAREGKGQRDRDYLLYEKRRKGVSL